MHSLLKLSDRKRWTPLLVVNSYVVVDASSRDDLVVQQPQPMPKPTRVPISGLIIICTHMILKRDGSIHMVYQEILTFNGNFKPV